MWRIETLAGQTGRDVFDCGIPEMNEWIRFVAGQSGRNGNTLTRVALHPEDGRVVGYYAQKTLTGSQLPLRHSGRHRSTGSPPG